LTDQERDTLEHITKVAQYLGLCAIRLLERAEDHDASKWEEPELSGYAGLTEALKGLEYGTPEHRAAFASFKPIVQHHYENNSHHPEHWPGGVNDMSLLDVLEMFADWKAANERGNADFARAIEVSVNRFDIDDQLAAILENTAMELGWT